MVHGAAGSGWQRLVVERGDRVSVVGQFVRLRDGDWLDIRQVDDLVGRNYPWKSNQSLRLEGIDAGRVPNGRDSDPSLMANRVRVTGLWRDDVVFVETQSTVPRPARAIRPMLDVPAPEGDWDTSEQATAVDGLDQLRASEDIVSDQWRRHHSGARLLCVAASNVEAVERVLSPQLPRRLNVVHSDYTATHLREVQDMFNSHHTEWTFEVWGCEGMTARCQPYADAVLARISTDLAVWADTMPDGLLRLHPTMTPA